MTADPTTPATTIEVGGERPYEVRVGAGVTDDVAGLLGGAEQVAVVYAPPLHRLAERIAAAATAAGVKPLLLDVPDAEKAKTFTVAQRCWEALGRAGFTRSDVVVGVGGGAVTDLAGFVAACWLRGVPVIQVPTSVLGMVDAAVGGKTGINTEAGKNLVGAFHPPAAVLCDLDALTSLPREELVAGLAEVVKCGFIADPMILDQIEADLAGVTEPESPVLRDVVERSIRVKADVVGADLRESGLREILNYGHTLAHAIEKVESYRWRHGHAVSVGLGYAAALGQALGTLDAATADRHREILAGLGLPTSYRSDAFDELHAAMRVDKKARGATLRFVVLEGLANPTVVSVPDLEVLRTAYLRATG